MAIKFSQFNERTESTPTLTLVGYDGNQNIRILAEDLFENPFISGTENTIAMFGTGGTIIVDSAITQQTIIGGDKLLTVQGFLNVDEDVTIARDLDVTRNTTLNGAVTLGNSTVDLITQTGTLYLNGPIKDTTDTLGNADQILVSDANGELTFTDLADISTGSAEVVEVPVKNLQGSALTKGDPVYISGSVGASGRLEVKLADASNEAKMPALGLLKQDLGINGEGFAVITGKLRNLPTDPIDGQTPLENDVIYVKAGGTTGAALTLTKPVGSNLIQNMGKVGRVSTSNDGTIVVSSILRTNDIPNLTSGKIWVGSTGNTIESTVVHLDEANSRVGIGTPDPEKELHIAAINSPTIKLEATSPGQYPTYGKIDMGFGGFLTWANVPLSGGIVGSRWQYTGPQLPGRGDTYINLHDSNGIDIIVNDSQAIKIEDGGNVGIGVTSLGATYRLDVAGNIKSEDGYIDVGNVSADDFTRVEHVTEDRFGFDFEFDNASTIQNLEGSLNQYLVLGDVLHTNGNNPLFGLSIKFEDEFYKRFQVQGNGKLILNEYGGGAFTGTVAKNLAVDENGNVIETSGNIIDGSGTTNYVAKWNDADTLADSVIYDNGTNVGIGTDDPDYKLDVSGTGRFTGDLDVVNPTDNTRFTRINQFGIQFGRTTSRIVPDAGNHILEIGNESLSWGLIKFDAREFRFTPENNQPVQISKMGNVGINASPTDAENKLHVKGNILIEGNQYNSVNTGAKISFSKNDGTRVGGIGYNRDRLNVTDPQLFISGAGDVNEAGVNSVMRIDSSGRVAIKTDNASPMISNLHVGGFVQIGNQPATLNGYLKGAMRYRELSDRSVFEMAMKTANNGVAADYQWVVIKENIW